MGVKTFFHLGGDLKLEQSNGAKRGKTNNAVNYKDIIGANY